MKISKEKLVKIIKEELLKEGLLKENEYDVDNKSIAVGLWDVQLHQDEDGHLSVWIKHKDGTIIHDAEAGGEYGEEAEFRFTTEGISNAYRKSTGEIK